MKVFTLFVALALAFGGSAPMAEAHDETTPQQSQNSDAADLQKPASADQIQAYLKDGADPAPPVPSRESEVMGFLVVLGLIVLALVIFWTLRHSPLRASRQLKEGSPAEPSPPASLTKTASQEKAALTDRF